MNCVCLKIFIFSTLTCNSYSAVHPKYINNIIKLLLGWLTDFIIDGSQNPRTLDGGMSLLKFIISASLAKCQSRLNLINLKFKNGHDYTEH